MAQFTRRDFLMGSAITAGAVAATSLAPPAQAAKRLATDWVPLGNSGVSVTRLALGTGTFAGRIQRELGQEGFTRLVRHAYDNGIRFFESAQTYGEMHGMLATALKGLPRDSYRLMTKMRWRGNTTPLETIDRFRRELNTEYLDIVLLHAVGTSDWPAQSERQRDAFDEAKSKKILLAHGASCHGLLPLEAVVGNKWMDVVLIRINHDGTRMDTIRGDTLSGEKGDVKEVAAKAARIHAQGTGVLGMKLAGEGAFQEPEQREASIKFVMGLGTVDAITIGYKSTAEVDEAIERVNRNLNT